MEGGLQVQLWEDGSGSRSSLPVILCR